MDRPAIYNIVCDFISLKSHIVWDEIKMCVAWVVIGHVYVGGLWNVLWGSECMDLWLLKALRGFCVCLVEFRRVLRS